MKKKEKEGKFKGKGERRKRRRVDDHRIKESFFYTYKP